MRNHLIEQQDRGKSRKFREQSRVSEHEADQQRLLHSGRGVSGGDRLLGMVHGEIGEMGPFERATSGRIAGAIVTQQRTVSFI